MYIVLIGPPGCGKGTQSAKLVNLLGVPHFSTGEALRAVIGTQTELGRRVSECVSRGQLVSDELVMELVVRRLGEPDCDRGCLFDGVPRNLVQARSLDDVLAGRQATLQIAIQMQVDEDELIRRIRHRALVEGRADDSVDTLKQRLRVYRSATAPVLDYYSQQGKLRPIDALGTPQEVFLRIQALLPA